MYNSKVSSKISCTGGSTTYKGEQRSSVSGSRRADESIASSQMDELNENRETGDLGNILEETEFEEFRYGDPRNEGEDFIENEPEEPPKEILTVEEITTTEPSNEPVVNNSSTIMNNLRSTLSRPEPGALKSTSAHTHCGIDETSTAASYEHVSELQQSIDNLKVKDEEKTQRLKDLEDKMFEVINENKLLKKALNMSEKKIVAITRNSKEDVFSKKKKHAPSKESKKPVLNKRKAEDRDESTHSSYAASSRKKKEDTKRIQFKGQITSPPNISTVVMGHDMSETLDIEEIDSDSLLNLVEHFYPGLVIDPDIIRYADLDSNLGTIFVFKCLRILNLSNLLDDSSVVSVKEARKAIKKEKSEKEIDKINSHISKFKKIVDSHFEKIGISQNKNDQTGHVEEELEEEEEGKEELEEDEESEDEENSSESEDSNASSDSDSSNSDSEAESSESPSEDSDSEDEMEKNKNKKKSKIKTKKTSKSNKAMKKKNTMGSAVAAKRKNVHIYEDLSDPFKESKKRKKDKKAKGDKEKDKKSKRRK